MRMRYFRLRKCKHMCLMIILLFFLGWLVLVTLLYFNYCNKCVYRMYGKPIEHTKSVTNNRYENKTLTFQERQDIFQQNTCKFYNTDEPVVIIQYGPPRTASTLQYQILCVMLVIVHEHNARSVGCYFNKSPSHKYSVLKTHGVKYFFEALTQNAKIFMTTSSSMLPPKWQRQKVLITEKLKYLNMSVCYISDIDLVSKRSHNIAFEYQAKFGLTDDQMSKAVEYLRYWDILRVCCGRQMSSDWRNQLSPISGYKPHRDPHDRTYPACEMYNISRVEKLFINTHIYQRFAHIASIRDTLLKPSTIDGKLDGNYCERCNQNITKYHITETGERCV